MALKLNERPDGYGFLYGTLTHGEQSHNVNVLPPKPEWRGDVVLPGYEPHATDWIVFLDGTEYARVRRRQDLDSIGPRLLAR